MDALDPCPLSQIHPFSISLERTYVVYRVLIWQQFRTLPVGGSHRGFDYLELATHGPLGPLHYARWLAAEHPEAVAGYYPVLDKDFQVNAAGGGDTGAP